MFLSPRVIQIIGIVLLLALAVFWAITDRESALFMGAATGLIGIGAVQGVRVMVSGSNAAPPKAQQEQHDDDGCGK